MTGYAREAGQAGSMAWVWEGRSVNGRGLDLRCRMPPGFDRLEPQVRTAVAAVLSRGNVSLTLTIADSAQAAPALINRALLDQLIALAGEYAGRGGMAPPRLDGLLAVRGVVENGAEREGDEAAAKARDAAMLASLQALLAALALARLGEGEKLAAVLGDHLREIEALVAEARANAATQPAAIKARLEAQVAELLGASPALPPERLAQEAALLAVKADVREELDRLTAHIAAARTLLSGGGAIGRKLEFLTQEFNREANTLCSKASDIALTRIGLALKAAVDRLREQSLNIE